MKHVFIINRISGKGKGFSLVSTVREVCKQMNLDYEIRITDFVGHAREIAEEYKGKKNITIYAVGGDGTLLEVVNGLDSRIPLGAIPGGSGEDFLRYFHLDVSNIKQYIIDTINAEPISIDIGKTDKMLFLNTTSCGIDASINAEASNLIRKTIITKGPAYGLSILKNAVVLNPLKAKLSVDGKRYDNDYLVISCMNGKYYGNGVKAAPHADVQDGFLDLVLVKKIKGLKVYKLLVSYLTGNGDKCKEIEVVHAKKIVLDTDEQINIQSDGENYKSNHLEIEILPKYLKLKIPKTTK